MKVYSVYILASQKNGTLYIGRSENLANRISDHKNKNVEGFTKRYDVTKLVYFENFDNAIDAAEREKRLKKWKREWKIKLIQTSNADWQDLYYQLNK